MTTEEKAGGSFTARCSLVSHELAVLRVQDRDGARWTSPRVLSSVLPTLCLAVSIGGRTPTAYKLCFCCHLHGPAQVHEVPLLLLCF